MSLPKYDDLFPESDQPKQNADYFQPETFDQFEQQFLGIFWCWRNSLILLSTFSDR